MTDSNLGFWHCGELLLQTHFTYIKGFGDKKDSSHFFLQKSVCHSVSSSVFSGGSDQGHLKRALHFL